MVMAREKGKRKPRKTKEKEKRDNNLPATEKGKKKRGRKPSKPSTNAARERSRVQNLKQAFLELQKALPNVPQGTKLSKLDILLLASNYISHLMSRLSNGHLEEHLKRLKDKGTLHPIKKWPMRSRLYVSDPMWLYRSQALASQQTGSYVVGDRTLKREEQDESADSLSPDHNSASGSSDEAGLWLTQEEQLSDPMNIPFDICKSDDGKIEEPCYPSSPEDGFATHSMDCNGIETLADMEDSSCGSGLC